MNPEEKISLLTSEEVQSFIRKHLKDEPASLALKWKGPVSIPARDIIEQVEGWQKAEKKFPELLVPGLLLPPRVNLEQTSSAETAKYKASLIPGEGLVADLTGGFGIDAIFFSRTASRVIMCEPDPWLVSLAKHNLRVLGIENISVVNSRAEDFILPDETSFVYLDPSRRSGSGKKVFDPRDYEPDPFSIQSNFRNIPFMLKTSPMADIQDVVSHLNSVREVHIVSRNRQVRELLFKTEPGYSAEPEIIVTDPGLNFIMRFEREEENSMEAEYRLPEEGDYLYQPLPALMKAGCFKLLGRMSGTFRPAPDTNVYTSSSNVSFPGNCFRIEKIIGAGLNEVKKALDGRDWVAVSKNFPLSSEELGRKLKLSGSDEKYVWFIKTRQGNRALLTRKTAGNRLE